MDREVGRELSREPRSLLLHCLLLLLHGLLLQGLLLGLLLEQGLLSEESLLLHGELLLHGLLLLEERLLLRCLLLAGLGSCRLGSCRLRCLLLLTGCWSGRLGSLWRGGLWSLCHDSSGGRLIQEPLDLDRGEDAFLRQVEEALGAPCLGEAELLALELPQDRLGRVLGLHGQSEEGAVWDQGSSIPARACEDEPQLGSREELAQRPQPST